MGAQVVSGIGFLGAGTIILSGGKVKGLTTAAGLWATACIGLAIGIGFYEGALIGGLTIIVTLALLRNYSHKLTHRSPYISLYLLMEGIGDFNRLNGYLASVGAALQSVDFSPGNGCGGLLAVEIELMLPKAMTKETLVEGIDRIGGISAVNIE
jgi:putative Mg2+ transporter-C (MgtC) family protein